jgi:hypothetical protein
METKNISEAKLAWSLWQRLQELADLLWDRYDQEFQDFPINEDYNDVMENDLP